MMSQTLREARKCEEVYEKRINDTERPLFHLTPRTGWMNDPNGFCYFQGRYHLFYQYNPFSSRWASMHWGHAMSRDLLHWEYLPAALAPDESYDYDGCFSGGAQPLPDGSLMLMYTGVRLERGRGGRVVEVQTQNIAIGNGVDFEKYENNPVLDEHDLPAGASREDFRDPRVIREKDGTYTALLGSRAEDGTGQILRYTSEDGIAWTYAGKLAVNHGRFGRMWECPDYFELDGKKVMLTSPQDMFPEGFEYHNGNGTLCLIGTEDPATGMLVEEANQAIDYGIDFYAPQTVAAPDGRRIMIGWMQNWDAVTIKGPEEKWAGQMSIPRELSVKDGRLWQWPVRELDDLPGETIVYENETVNGQKQLPGVAGRVMDMELTIRPVPGEELFHKFAFWFAADDRYHTALSYRPHDRILKVDRKFSGSLRAIIHQRRALVRSGGETDPLRLRIILDRFSMEVFINGGEQVMSAALYTPIEADGIWFRCDGQALIDVKCRKL